MTEQLQAIMLYAERSADMARAQLEETIYYHPAWFIISVILLYQSIRWLLWNTAKKRFSADKCTNIMITGGAQGLGKLLAEQFLRRN
jgi:hypothetical protein